MRDFLIRNLRRGGIFLAIGGLGFVIDAVVYNVLVFAGGSGPLHSEPLLAKTIAVIAGLIVTYSGNKLLTYRDRKAPISWGQVVRYGVVNVLAVLVQLGCLGFSRYVLGFDTPLADNISGTLIGQALATGLRYVLYTLWVFPHSPGEDPITFIEEHHEDSAPRS
ncbi:GtrA family protein [Microbacterium yannicii]|uniref:GtrA family protein n=1 Tax=Microbacterium yannicii TaxID=671622 RepID=UPI0003692FA1|nr:GtrA family protein [Microbacterium yannicii]